MILPVVICQHVVFKNSLLNVGGGAHTNFFNRRMHKKVTSFLMACPYDFFIIIVMNVSICDELGFTSLQIDIFCQLSHYKDIYREQLCRMQYILFVMFYQNVVVLRTCWDPSCSSF